MKVLKVILLIAITMALSITLTMKSLQLNEEENPPYVGAATDWQEKTVTPAPARRVSRFLQEQRNPRAADHCHKDNEVCNRLEGGGNSTTCCNNKCVNLVEDHQNCGACKRKCAFTEACCRGECVMLAYDKRHCGRCNNRCSTGLFCIYGMCDYA